MTTNLLNSAVLREARHFLKNNTLKAPQILGWGAGQESPAGETEEAVQLPVSGAWVIVRKANDHR